MVCSCIKGSATWCVAPRRRGHTEWRQQHIAKVECVDLIKSDPEHEMSRSLKKLTSSFCSIFSYNMKTSLICCMNGNRTIEVLVSQCKTVFFALRLCEPQFNFSRENCTDCRHSRPRPFDCTLGWIYAPEHNFRYKCFHRSDMNLRINFDL